MEKYNPIKTYIQALSKDLGHGLILLGRAGLGKTESVLNSLQELNYKERQHYLYLTSYISPLQLYKKMQEVNKLKNPKILILDDAEAVFQSQQSIGLIKSALWQSLDNKRKVCWVSGTSQLFGVDKEFYFEGKIIFMLNELNLKDPSISAIADRTLFYKFDLSREDVISLIKKRALEKDEFNIPKDKRLEIADYIGKVATDETSLRLLVKAFQMYKISPNHYQELLLNLIN